ncbi:MAG TPA: peptidylprolyl isomerase [Candidatus Acidoferrales bacterium]|nr:peptidylprolyl isomerase [Candidatus Acidoferrales bacterium]
MRKNLRTFFLVAGFLALARSLSFAVVVEQVIVAIDGEPYTLGNIKSYAESKMRRPFPKGDLNRIEKDDKEVLEQFITEKLVAAEIKRLGIAISPADIDQYIEEIKKRNQLTDEELTEALRREGLTREQYREQVRNELEKGQIVQREVREKVNVTADDVQRYYQQNGKKFMTREKFHLRHILLALSPQATPAEEKQARERIAELRRQLLAGEDFAKLAKSFSEGSGAHEGGDLGWINRGTLVPEIEEAAAKLAVGQVSQPVRTSLGFHLIKLEGKKGGEVPPLEEVADKIKEELYAKTLEERFQKWLKTDLRKRYRVDVKLPGVVFRPEEDKGSTLNTLMASASRKSKKERSFLSYLNPLSYIARETPVEDDQGQPTGTNVLSVFGIPLFRTADDDAPPDPFATPEPKKDAGESKGFFSSLNPFSSQ